MTLSEETGTGIHKVGYGRIWERGALWLALLLSVALALSGCAGGRKAPDTPTPDTKAGVLRIASEYQSEGNLEKARQELKALGISDPSSYVAELAVEYERREGASSENTQALARLAVDLGYHGNDLVALVYGTPTPVPTVEPATPTLAPAPTDTPTSTPSPTWTPTPEEPVVVAKDWTNVRMGPGTVYPPVGHLKPGEQALVTGRGPGGKWLRIRTASGKTGWVFEGVVGTQGPVDSVAKVSEIPPTPEPTFTPTPAATPTPSVDFVVTEQRLWTVEENGGSVDNGSVRCGYKHQIYVTVVDRNGNPLNGVVVERVYAKTRGVSGTKGPGRLVFSLFSHGDKLRVVGDVSGHTFTSQVTRNLDVRDDRIPIQDLIAAHYCTDPVTCQHLIDTNHLCRGHYSWSVVFQRQW